MLYCTPYTLKNISTDFKLEEYIVRFKMFMLLATGKSQMKLLSASFARLKT